MWRLAVAALLISGVARAQTRGVAIPAGRIELKAQYSTPPYAPKAPAVVAVILMGETDDWTPAAPCPALAARFPDRITLVTYPDTFPDFDVPGLQVGTRTGLAFTAGGGGDAHSGTNEAARVDAIARVLAFLDR